MVFNNAEFANSILSWG